MLQKGEGTELKAVTNPVVSTVGVDRYSYSPLLSSTRPCEFRLLLATSVVLYRAPGLFIVRPPHSQTQMHIIALFPSLS